jgi:hypothetical protein
MSGLKLKAHLISSKLNKFLSFSMDFDHFRYDKYNGQFKIQSKVGELMQELIPYFQVLELFILIIDIEPRLIDINDFTKGSLQSLRKILNVTKKSY